MGKKMIKYTALTTATVILAACGLVYGPTAFHLLAAQPTANWEAPVQQSLRTAPFKTMDGETKTLEDFAGQVVLIVNTASRCGFTPQYAELQTLFERHEQDGLKVIAFPANNFGNQEPGTNEEIAEFCQVNFGTTFPVMARLDVIGPNQSPLFAALTGEASPLPGDIRWNFEKFLIDRQGRLVARFPSRTRPLSDDITSAVAKALAATSDAETSTQESGG